MKPGASLTPVIVIVNVCAALVSTPPLAVPPSSCTCTVTVAVPLRFAAGVKVNVPFAATAGCAENSGLLSLLTMKSTACVSPGPALIAVAHPVTECAPLSSSAV